MLVAEIAAIVLLGATFVPTSPSETNRPVSRSPPPVSPRRSCSSASGGTWPTSTGRGGRRRADICDDRQLRVRASGAHGPGGTTVTWTNLDGVDHSVFATDQSLSSGALGRGSAFEFTFETPGDTSTYALPS